MLCYFLITGALLLSLSTYQALFYQYQGVSNELAYRRTFWLLEAGLECGIGQLATRSIAISTDVCQLPTGLKIETTMLDSNRYRIVASLEAHQVARSAMIAQQPRKSASWIAASWSDIE